ncbi:S24 family peptidase [Saccharospirillum alexandrii]|uniref:S24 family peptidase n=1 Tax=Saccharospirillum alexandrii TaxID=2448477 RepID=UPI001719F5F6
MSVQLLGRCNTGPQLNLPLFVEGQSVDDDEGLDHDIPGIDLASLCIRNPESSILVSVHSMAMAEAGIIAGDTLIVDRSARASQGDIILAGYNGELMVRELQLTPSPRLLPRHPDFDILVVPEHETLSLIGKVSHIIRSL